ncbi:Uma2 family endonuclease [Stratiformator vulcanicus]|uniref:Putative restriction endonuclease domain-containing protein n=1 Tax=Stratiformator vulcanicus TaxID=2527980 RepID=A0A517QZ97_9PLAN|nr:Uma2 family endonuclease [Stratiformator vulcanicus]QDT36961.1 hypothetical protein Pan189_13250 [Stratiformator vulcanicus]
MSMTDQLPDEVLRIPPIHSHDDFRAWALSEDFPQRGRIDYFDGALEIDMSPEAFLSHGKLKVALTRGLSEAVEDPDRGEVFSDSTLVTVPDVGLSSEPDVGAILHQTVEMGVVRFRQKQGRAGDFIEVVGPPDLVVEVVSDSSVTKDFHRLAEAYFRAGVPEYWIADGRGDAIVFAIMVPGEGEYVETSTDDGGRQWSPLLQAWIHLDVKRTRRQTPRFKLVVAPQQST